MSHVTMRRWQFWAGLVANFLTAVGCVAFIVYAMGIRSELRVQNAVLDAMWHSGSAVVVVDDGGLIEGWSKGAETLTGWNASEMKGKPLTIIMPPELVKRHLTSFVLAARSGRVKVASLECDVLTKGEVKVPTIIVIRSMPKGRFIGVIDRKTS